MEISALRSTVSSIAVALLISLPAFSADPLSKPGTPTIELLPEQTISSDNGAATDLLQPEHQSSTPSHPDELTGSDSDSKSEAIAVPTPSPESSDNQPAHTPAATNGITQPDAPDPEAPQPATVEQTPPQRHFIASTTIGFEANLLDDGSVSMYWPPHPTATEYHIYRQGEYIDTAYEPRYLDSGLFDQSYYYKIQIIENGNYSYTAVGLTVDVTGTGRVDPNLPTPKANLLNEYELVFEDEFNGTSLDPSKWKSRYWWGDDVIINYEEQHYVDILENPNFGFNPLSFDGDALIISSIRTPPHLLEKANNQPYLSGVISSHDTFSFTYGYVEARAQLSYGQGLWYAFWLMNSYYDKDKPEIDIIESIGHEQDVVYHTYHFFDEQDNRVTTDAYPTPGIDYTTDYHTFGVEWMPGVLIYYVDRIERHRIVDPKVSQEEMYILANTALGGWWPDSPDYTTPFPTTFKIDYIRVYQKPGLLQADPAEGQSSGISRITGINSPSPGHSLPDTVAAETYPTRP